MEIDSIRESWQAQPAALATFTATMVRRKAKTQVRDIWLDATFNGAGVAALGAVLLGAAILGDTLVCRIGFAMAGAGYWYTAFRLLRASRLPAGPSAADLYSCITFYRANLEKLRDRSASVFWWSILPSAPGIVLALIGWELSSPAEWTVVVRLATAWLGINILFWRANSKAAARYQKEIRLLDDVG
jgi:hypothetical protein